MQEADMRWRIIDSYFETFGLARAQFQGYHHFMGDLLEHIVRESSDITIVSPERKQKHVIQFGDVQIMYPNIKEASGNIHDIFPFEARERRMTYANPVVVNIRHTVTHYFSDEMERVVQTNVYEKMQVPLLHMPCMVKSKYCTLSKSKLRGTTHYKECPYDSGGYFVVNGNNKVLQSQLKLRVNKPYVFNGKGPTKFKYFCETRSCHETKWRSTSTLKVGITYNPGTMPEIFVMVPFVARGASPLEIPLVAMFVILGIDTPGEMMRYIFPSPDAGIEKEIIRETISPMLNNPMGKMSRDEIIKWIGMEGTKEKTHEKRLRYVLHIIFNEFLPHLGMQDDEITRTKKAFFVGMIVRKLVSVFHGIEAPDDRDDNANKRLDGPGPLLAILFRQLYRNTLKHSKAQLEKAIRAGKFVQVENFINDRRMTAGINYHFGTGNWSMTKGVNTGVVQVLNMMSCVARLSHLERHAIPINREGKASTPRMLHPTDWGIACPAETPEGGGCGLIKNKALLMHVTVGANTRTVTTTLLRLPGVEKFERLKDRGTPVFVNGNIVAYCSRPDALVARIREMRRTHNVTFELGVIRKKRGVFVTTDGGNCKQPLLRVSSLEALPHILRTTAKSDLWNELFYKGHIEYLGKEEEMSNECCVAVYAVDILSKPAGYYTHVELDPTVIFGVTALLIPFPDRNQAPRVMYQASMGKQSICMPGLNYRYMMDMHTYVLDQIAKPLVSTRIARIPAIGNLPTGLNATVAILCYSGFNQEDSILLSKSAVERGLGRVTYFRAYKDEVSSRNTEEEQFERPPDDSIGIKNANYTTIQDDGLPLVGQWMEAGDVIIGKTMTTTELTDEGVQVLRKRDRSTVLKKNEMGWVDSVMTERNKDGKPLVCVKLRSVRKPQVGDKFASRHGQKGTVGMVVPDEDMPFTSTGIRPDIIMNPHAVPSRMTIGHLMETLLGKACAMEGEYGDGTAFRQVKDGKGGYRKITVEDISNELDKNGMQRQGYEQMYCGYTGEPMKGLVFIGPTYYQRLRHMVKDKVHSRARGPVTTLVRQPMEGRSRQGGLRFGEMERDALLSHGSSRFVQDRLMDNSDKYIAPVCNKCGLFAHPAHSNRFGKSVAGRRPYCKACDSYDVHMIKLPYAFKVMVQELMGLQIAPRLRLQESGEAVEPRRRILRTKKKKFNKSVV